MSDWYHRGVTYDRDDAGVYRITVRYVPVCLFREGRKWLATVGNKRGRVICTDKTLRAATLKAAELIRSEAENGAA